MWVNDNPINEIEEDNEEDAVEDENTKVLGAKLFEASLNGETAEVARLLDLNAPVNHIGTSARTPLMIASIQGHLDVISLLMSRSANLEARAREEGRRTALMYACIWGPPAAVQLLVERGGNLEARSSDGKTPLMYACIKNRLDIVALLVDSLGALVNYKNYLGFDALLYASLNAHMKIVLFLISRGGDPRVVSYYGSTALTKFGDYTQCRPTKKEQKMAQRKILKKWKAGCHPDARWLRRRNFLLAIVGSRLRLMARDLAAQKLIQATMDLNAPLDPEDRSTPEANWTFLLKSVFGHDGIVRSIVSFN